MRELDQQDSLPLPPSDDDGSSLGMDVGFFYEIDHDRSPVQLRSLRAVMVSEKTEQNVTVKFPSMASLLAAERWKASTFPPLDDELAMGSKLAGKVLSRRIPVDESDLRSGSRSFWLASPPASNRNGTASGGRTDAVLKNGSCLFTLRDNGLTQWGAQRKQVFIGKHKDHRTNAAPRDSSEIDLKIEEEEEDQEEKIPGEDRHGEDGDVKKNLKRKRKINANRLQRSEKGMCVYAKKKTKQKVLKNSKDRWSAERYKLAEENMLEIMKTKGAACGNPIMRPELRSEARKKIGDTGLLDHLLKHMAGKLAPGGSERFRRRHNADGAMEYWLERADLVNVRREAGVQDPYWTPPPGWEPGDSPTQDPTCAKELKLVKEEMAQMKREMQELVSREGEANNAMVVIPKSGATDQNMEDADCSLLPLKEKHESLLKRKAKIEKQLTEISYSLSQLQDEMGTLTSAIEDSMKSERITFADKGISKEEENDSNRREEDESKGKGGETRDEMKEGDRKIAIEDKNNTAAKRQRLKSGFTVCKPQGTFLWPNTNINGGANGSSSSSTITAAADSKAVVLAVEDLFRVPTPPSASSSTPPLPWSPSSEAPGPPSPVKPLAERLAVKLTVSTLSPTLPPDFTTAIGEKKALLLNLNEVPLPPASLPTTRSYGAGLCGTPTPHPLLLTVPTSPPPPRCARLLARAEAQGMRRPWEGGARGSTGLGSSGDGSHRCPVVVSGRNSSATWLALATSDSPSHNSNRG